MSESRVCSPTCDVCTWQKRGLGFVAGSNLTATLWEAVRGLWWGQVFWNMSAHEKNGSAQWRPLSHFHSFVHLSLLFTAWLSLGNHCTGCTQSTKCPCVISHLLLFMQLFPPPIFLSLSLTPSTISFFFLEAPFNSFALTFLFRRVQMWCLAGVVTSHQLNVRGQHLPP